MAELELGKPFRSWRVPGASIVIKFTHEEVLLIDDASIPTATIAALIPKYGTFVAAGIKVSSWMIRKVDEHNGKRGVAVIVPMLPSTGFVFEDPYGELVSVLTNH